MLLRTFGFESLFLFLKAIKHRKKTLSKIGHRTALEAGWLVIFCGRKRKNTLCRHMKRGYSYGKVGQFLRSTSRARSGAQADEEARRREAGQQSKKKRSM
jgi:hypothetical protein